MHRTGQPGACQAQQMSTSRHGITSQKPSTSSNTAAIPSKLTLRSLAYSTTCSEGFVSNFGRTQLTERSTVLLQKLTCPQLAKKFRRILRNTNVHYRVHNSRLRALVTSQINLLHALLPNPWRSFLILSSDLIILSESRKFLGD